MKIKTKIAINKELLTDSKGMELDYRSAKSLTKDQNKIPLNPILIKVTKKSPLISIFSTANMNNLITK